MKKITVHLEAFEGPLDLLYHLIEKNEIDIYNIPIASLTDQYIEYIENADNKNMESMSEFIIMASTLLEIKSKMLIPSKRDDKSEENEEDPREELVKKLVEYKKFKNITQDFKKYEEEASLVLYKKNKEFEKLFENIEENDNIEAFLNGVTLNDIFKAFQEVMKRKETKVDKVRSSFKSVERDLYTIDEKINYIKDLLFITPKIIFRSIFRSGAKKMEIVVTFLALLELIKTKDVYITQEKPFGDIIILKNNGSD